MPVTILFCYSHEDEPLLNKLKAQLKPLQRHNIIDVWYDRNISAGTEWERDIDQHLNSAQIILLLVSPDFMNSDYCYSIEMKRALERHEKKEAVVIPIILRHVYWQEEFGKLQVLPTDAKPVIARHWHSEDEAFLDIVSGIRKVIGKIAVPSPVKDAAQQNVQASDVDGEDKSSFDIVSGIRKVIGKIAVPSPVKGVIQSPVSLGYLVIINSGPTDIPPGTRYPLEIRTSIGRGPTNTIRIQHPTISSENTNLWYKNGVWYVQDAGSHNGTFVNEQPAREALPAKIGDIVRVGYISFQIKS